MLDQALLFLLNTLLTMISGAFLLRFYMQRMRAPFHNPFGKFLLAITDFAVKPLRRMLPGILGWDWASLLAAWLGQYLLVIASFLLLGHLAALSAALGGLALLSIVKLLALCVNLLIWIVILNAVMSWIQPYHWLNTLTGGLVSPFLQPLRRAIPLIGGVDLSPLALIMLAQLVLMLPIIWLERLAAQLV